MQNRSHESKRHSRPENGRFQPGSNGNGGEPQRQGRSFDDDGERFGGHDEQRSFDDRRGYDDRDFPRRTERQSWDADRFADDGGFEGSFDRPQYNPYENEDPRAFHAQQRGRGERAWRDSARLAPGFQGRGDESVGWSPYDPDYSMRSERSRGYGSGMGPERLGSDRGYGGDRYGHQRGFGSDRYANDRNWGSSSTSSSMPPYRTRNDFGGQGYGAQGGFGGQGWQGRMQGERMGQGGNMGPMGDMGARQGRGDQRWGMETGDPIGARRLGRGPKGYKRSDERIREDVCDRLSDMHDIDASDVEVEVKNGEVTLSGTIPERNMKYAIEHCCERVSGVSDITNQLRLKREATSSSSSSSSSMGRDHLDETSRSQRETSTSSDKAAKTRQ
jgi:osmotically-inducible protein OsmY